jgi:hypothetical protein
MNRRGFLSAMLKAGVGAMILPSAGRIWIPKREVVTFLTVDTKFVKLPFYCVETITSFPNWTVFDQFYGKIDWQPNMSNLLRTV